MNDYVDRSPARSPAMRAAYARLAEARLVTLAAHERAQRTDDWEPHRRAVAAEVAANAEIARIALARG